MKYFSISSVEEAYHQISATTKEKFWGILGILHSIDETVYPNKCYSVETGRLSQYFEDLFRLSDKKDYSGTDEYSFVFSTHWVEIVSQDYLEGRPSIKPILVWAYRNHSFASEIGGAELFNKFLEDYHITKEAAEQLFRISFTDSLSFEDSRYSDTDLLSHLGGSLGSDKTTIKLGGTFAVANPGDLSRGPYFQPLYAALQTLKCLTIYPFNIHDYYNLGSNDERVDDNGIHEDEMDYLSRQVIYYGAPGTGKSKNVQRRTKDAEKNERVFRTTFHPDSDYSTFVGCYKPTTIMKPVRNVAGDIVKSNGEGVYEESITYQFVPQAFVLAYLKAWNTTEPVYLVIEEINRGNCAQIFGDLFQLLDRGDDKRSEYPIKADSDLERYIANNIGNNRENIPEEIRSGKKLMLPENLYILATMNTSDQSLFPIDSAFKRRWDWMYTPIANAGKGWKIDVDGKLYDWWQFLFNINNLIGAATNSEDKKLGYFFCKAENKVISAETFVSKVVFYLWNDVFKDFPEEAGNVFKDTDGSVLSFNKFYSSNNGISQIRKDKVRLMLDNLKVGSNGNDTIDIEEMENNSTPSNDKNYLKEIIFPDGTTIDASTGTFDAFIKAVRKMGVERVGAAAESLKYRRHTCPLISKEKFSEVDGKDGYSYVQEGDYYFVRGAKTYTYVRILEDLNEMLQVGMTIRNK